MAVGNCQVNHSEWFGPIILKMSSATRTTLHRRSRGADPFHHLSCPSRMGTFGLPLPLKPAATRKLTASNVCQASCLTVRAASCRPFLFQTPGLNTLKTGLSKSKVAPATLRQEHLNPD